MTKISNEDILALLEPGTTLSTPYRGAKVPLTAICIRGHERSIIWSNLKSRGTGALCKECKTPSIKSRFLDAIKHLKLLTPYVNTQTKVLVGASCGHEWPVLPQNLVYRGDGANCPICRHGATQYKSQLFSKLLENNIKLLDNYTNTNGNQLVEYSCGHTSTISNSNAVQHNSGLVCRVCNPRISRPEQELLDYIKSIYDGWIVERDRDLIAPQELDIVLPDKDLAIEFNGVYWHSDRFKERDYHTNKTEQCKALGIQLIHVQEDEWVEKQLIVKSRLANLLGKSLKIFARNCEVVKLAFPHQFLKDNHIQGAGAPTSSNYGLAYRGDLVAVMTFAKPRFSNAQDFELVRYCSVLNTVVIGGASKLLKAFLKDHPGTSIISYSDRRWSNGNLYKQLGFTYSHTSKPNYKYSKQQSVLSRYKCQKHLLKELFPKYYKPDLTEAEIMSAAGYSRIYDSGSDIWTYNQGKSC